METREVKYYDPSTGQVVSQSSVISQVLSRLLYVQANPVRSQGDPAEINRASPYEATKAPSNSLANVKDQLRRILIAKQQNEPLPMEWES